MPRDIELLQLSEKFRCTQLLGLWTKSGNFSKIEMQGGAFGSLCFLAFLLSSGVRGSGQNLQDQALGEFSFKNY